MYKLLFVLALVSVANAQRNYLLKTEFVWKHIDFEWISPAQKNWYIANGLYNHTRVLPLDVDRFKDGRTFVTTVRRVGVPVTLSTISSVCDSDSGYLLRPYPSWLWYNPLFPCEGILNVYRMQIDECDRLWVLDTGALGGQHICPAKLLVFNLRNNQLLKRIVIPDLYAQNANGTGNLVTPVVEIGLGCDDFTVYMADVDGFGLVIYRNGQFIRQKGDMFSPERHNSDITVAGETFHMEDGVAGMALTPKYYTTQRFLFFRPMSSRSMYGVNSYNLKNSFLGSIPFSKGNNVLTSQAVAMAFSSKGVLFYGLTKELAIGCWKLQNYMHPPAFINLLADWRLQFLSGVKVKWSTTGEEYLLMVSNRYQKIALDSMNWKDNNYHILSIPVQKLIQGTVCA